MRAEGRSYSRSPPAAARIASTVRATRAAPTTRWSRARGRAFRARWRTAHHHQEAKTGYALELDGELRCSRSSGWSPPGTVALSPRCSRTACPPSAPAIARSSSRVGAACRRARRAISVDVYCDQGAFTLDETRAILGAAPRAGLEVPPTRAVADSARRGSSRARRLSADTSRRSPRRRRAPWPRRRGGHAARRGCVKLRLPPPTVARPARRRLRLALGTDLNHGSSLSESLRCRCGWPATTSVSASTRRGSA